MKSILKWFIIIGSIFLILIIAAVIIIPQFIDIKKYKPVIEEKVAAATGRSFFLGDDIDLSVFPWVGVKLTDVKLGNPKGFGREQMVSVEKFEVRLKVMPLLSRQIEIKTFVLEHPEIYLEKLKDGTANWEGMGPKKAGDVKKKDVPGKAKDASGAQGLPISELRVGNFSITKGQLIYLDQATGMKKEITDLNLNLADIRLDGPVKIEFNANLDGRPVSLSGTAGPVGKTPGKGTMNLDFVLNIIDQLDVTIKGSVIDPAITSTVDIQVAVSPFSPRKLVAALDQDFPVETKDPRVLDNISLKTRIKGNPKNISLVDGVLVLDDSKLMFSATAKEFQKPDLTFDLQLDSIDLDRYLPEPPAKDEAGNEKTKAAGTSGPEKKTDYGPLRKLVLDGTVKAGRLKAANARVEDINVHVLAENGIITIDPMDLKLYKGSVDSKVVLNVQKNKPRTKVILDAKGIQAAPMIQDIMKKELIEGALEAVIDISIAGDAPEMIKQTLGGKGRLLFTDGAVMGIDLADSVRNAKSKLGLGEKPKEKPRTDFAELKIPFTSAGGLVTIDGTNLTSPLLRVLVNGKVNLPEELLDIRVEPKFVATLKGQGDNKQRSGLMVPVLITGSFTSPKIRPDLKGMIKGGGLDTQSLKDKLLGTQGDETTTEDTQKPDVKKQINSFLHGPTD